MTDHLDEEEGSGNISASKMKGDGHWKIADTYHMAGRPPEQTTPTDSGWNGFNNDSGVWKLQL